MFWLRGDFEVLARGVISVFGSGGNFRFWLLMAISRFGLRAILSFGFKLDGQFWLLGLSLTDNFGFWALACGAPSGLFQGAISGFRPWRWAVLGFSLGLESNFKRQCQSHQPNYHFPPRFHFPHCFF